MDKDSDFQISSWQEAEHFAAAHMRQLGFEDAEVTPPGADGGLDVVDPGGFAQVKHHSQPVGSPALQQLIGIGEARDGIACFYSLSGYTRAAIEVAEASEVALFSYSIAGAVGGWTERAYKLLEDGNVPSPGDVKTIAGLEWIAATQRWGQSVGDVFSYIANHLSIDNIVDKLSPEDVLKLRRFYGNMLELDRQLKSKKNWAYIDLLSRIIKLERVLFQVVQFHGMDYEAVERDARRIYGQQHA